MPPRATATPLPPGVLLPLVLALLAACAGTPEIDSRYRPTENLLEVLAVLRRHVPDDTYRFQPARDFTGRNVYRSSLLRLESLERLHAQSLRAGHLDGVIAFAKGRSLERLRAYDLAADSYRLAADREQTLAVEALRSADLCDRLHATVEMGLDLGDLIGNPKGANLRPEDWRSMIDEFDARIGAQQALLREAEGTHHHAIVREEFERTDQARARYFADLRHILPDGDLLAIAEYQRLATQHSDSKLINRHLLVLADLYADLAVEYADANPPETLRFDPPRFQEYIDAASQIYEMVANKDGTPEKLEASRRLEAFLAFALRIDRDRFTP